MREEVERLEENSIHSTIPFKKRRCHQIAEYTGSVDNLGQILHEMGCPGIDPSSVYWVKAGGPTTEARKEIIQLALVQH